MLINTDGIVLKQRKIANNRRIIVLFTRRCGKINAGTGINEKSRKKSALALRPFTYAEYDIFKNRSYYNIDATTVKKSYYSIGENLDCFMTASKVLEYLDIILEEEQARQGLFDMTIEFFNSLAGAKANFKTMLYAYLVKSLRLQGVMPELSVCADCGKPRNEFYGIAGGDHSAENEGNGRTGEKCRSGYFSVSAGGILCSDCAEREKSDTDLLIFQPDFDIVEVLRYFLDKPVSYFSKLLLKDGVSEELEILIGKYLDYYLGANVLKNDIDME